MRGLQEYRVAESADDALEFVHAHPGAAFLAGGTRLALGADPGLSAVVDLSRLGLDRIERAGGSTRLGATTSLERLRRDALAGTLGGGLLREALARTRTPAWRGHATLGGRLREMDPDDLVTTVLLVMDAVVELQRAPRSRPVEVALPEALGDDPRTLILALLVPDRPGWSYALEALSPTRLESPVAAVALGLRTPERRVEAARLAVCGLAPLPRRLPGVEAALIGMPADRGDFGQAVGRLLAEAAPETDARASREYREHLGAVLLARALRRTLEQAAGEAAA
jgi:carbon-monoxide dehydrogenase medium subunit